MKRESNEDFNYLIAAPIRRLWSLDKYFKSFKELDYNPKKIHYYFLLNNCLDEIEDKVKDFKLEVESKGSKLDYSRIQVDGIPDDSRKAAVRQVKIYRFLSELRNTLIHYFKNHTDSDYLLSVDSDIYVSPNILKEFSKWPECEYLSSWVSNDIFRKNNNALFSNCLNIDVRPFKEKNKNTLLALAKGFRSIHIQNIPVTDQPFEVDITGACFRISKKIVSDPCPRFDHHVQGEDIPFCTAVKMKGFKLWSIKNNLAFHDIRDHKEVI